jgi:hypothetical protein
MREDTGVNGTDGAPDPPVQIYDIPARGIGGSVPWLQERLRSDGVTIHPDSGLARAFATLTRFMEDARQERTVRLHSEDDFDHFAQYFAHASGADFLTKMLHRGLAFGLSGISDHIRHLASGDPVPTSPSARFDANHDDRNRVWELGLAAAVSTFAEGVALVEPDVAMTFQGRRVGLAAKVLYSDRSAKLVRRVVEGARQIEMAPVDQGFVVLNLVQLFPIGRTYANLARARVTNPATCLQVLDEWARTFFDQHRRSLSMKFQRYPKVKSIISLIPAIVPFQDSAAPLYRISCTSIEGREEDALPFELAFNGAFQQVLAWADRASMSPG